MIARVLSALLITAACLGSSDSQAALSEPAVQVLLWFDTEDYLLPADDDACKRLAQLLSDRHIQATFKVVGEKARVLERRGRKDVISALKKHVIAYHANLHSVHPTPTEYLADCGLLDGMAEFARREGGGAVDVRRVFGVPTLACYGQPGSSWAPQAIGALRQIGVAPHDVPCYVDEGDHIGMDGQPFWYMGVLNVYRIRQNCTRMDLHDSSAVEPAKEKVSSIAGRLRQEGGGLISIFYHPCEWVHEQFWDSINFSRGANPPRDQWRAPRQRTKEDTDAAFARFEQYVDHIRAIPGIQFITASDLPLLYPDEVRQNGAPLRDLAALAKRIHENKSIDFQIVDGRAYSAAEQFDLLTRAVGRLLDGKELVQLLKPITVLGPDSAPPQPKQSELSWDEFRQGVRDAVSFLERERRMPSRVFVGADAISPTELLTAVADVFTELNSNHKLPEGRPVPLRKMEMLAARFVAADSPHLFGDWIIHKEGFEAPKVMQLARLQAWTLKPALPQDVSKINR